MLQSISITNAVKLIADPTTVVLDIRDDQAFQTSHIPGAKHLHNQNLQEILNTMEFEQPVIVCCYHGIASQQAGQYLVSQGFEHVYSLEGGFEQWSAEGNLVEK